MSGGVVFVVVRVGIRSFEQPCRYARFRKVATALGFAAGQADPEYDFLRVIEIPAGEPVDD